MDHRIFNARTDVNAWGVQALVGESVLKVDWEKNPLLHRGIEPASAAYWSNALPTQLHLPHGVSKRMAWCIEEDVGYWKREALS